MCTEYIIYTLKVPSRNCIVFFLEDGGLMCSPTLDLQKPVLTLHVKTSLDPFGALDLGHCGPF